MLVDEFFCINCKAKLPEYFTICGIEPTDDLGSMRYIENKVHITVLKNQKIGITCPTCGEETFPAGRIDLQKIEEKKNKNKCIPESSIFEKFTQGQNEKA